MTALASDGNLQNGPNARPQRSEEFSTHVGEMIVELSEDTADLALRSNHVNMSGSDMRNSSVRDLETSEEEDLEMGDSILITEPSCNSIEGSVPGADRISLSPTQLARLESLDPSSPSYATRSMSSLSARGRHLGERTHSYTGQSWWIFNGYSKFKDCGESMNQMESRMVDEQSGELDFKEGVAQLVGTKYDLEPQGLTAWYLYFTPLRLPGGRRNCVGITLHIIALLTYLPLEATNIVTILSRDCNGKGNVLVACNCITIICFVLVNILTLIECSQRTAAELVFSFTTIEHGSAQWRHLHYFWRRRVTCSIPVGIIIAIGMAILTPDPKFNPLKWFECLPESVEFEWKPFQFGERYFVFYYTYRLFLAMPVAWFAIWAMNGMALILYTHYEAVRELAEQVADDHVVQEQIGRKYAIICARLRRFSKTWGWTIMYVIWGLVFNLIQSAISSALGETKGHEDRRLNNILYFVANALLTAWFLRWVAGINDEHDDFLTIVTFKGCDDKHKVADGKYMKIMMKMRGKVMAGPLPVTMSFFGMLVTVISSVGGIMVVQTGLVTNDEYICSEVRTANIDNFTSFSEFKVLVPKLH